MRAAAPGKLVLSGAYAVLEGAPAIVAAVDRYVIADTRAAPSLLTPEVREALGEAPAPWFDATALRDGDRKLGLGSSAAILVASLAARYLQQHGATADAALATAVFEAARQAHARAQQGGSGIDVAASSYGGIQIAERRATELALERTALPAALVVEVWTCPEAASTRDLLARVRDLEVSAPRVHARCLGRQGRAAEAARGAVRRGAAEDFVAALAEQHEALSELGMAAGANIVTPAVSELHRLAERQQAVVLPSGAGGGDIALYVGLTAPDPALSERANALRHGPLRVRLGARGVHQLGP